MRSVPWILACLLTVLATLPDARADKQAYERTQAEVENALELEASLTTPARIRPGAPVQLAARLRNRGTEAIKVVGLGNGCELGIVEPHVRYSVRHRALGGDPWRELPVRDVSGMCGMGDYRWHRYVVELAAGATLDLTPRLPAPVTLVDLKRPGQYEITLHYAFRRRGTTEVLPQADPVGDLGPMRRMPAFEVHAQPVEVEVVRPLEVVAAAHDAPRKGVAARLSDMLRLTLENWTDQSLALSAKRLRFIVRLRPAAAAQRLRRKPITISAGFATHTLKPGQAVTLIGPGGIYDEAWIAESTDAVEVQVAVAGIRPGAARVRSAWVRLERAD